MKSAAIFLFCFLCLTLPCTSNKHDLTGHNAKQRTKRGVPTIISILHNVASFGLKIFQFVQNGGDGDLQTDKELKEKLESTLRAVERNRKHLDEIKNLIKLSIYQNHIADDKKEILSCFHTFNFVLSEPESQAARELMEPCIGIGKYVSDIGRMLIGKPITYGQKSIYDLVIDSKGRCDHRDINGTFAYLYDLHVKGCVSITLAESMKYGNESGHFQNTCETTFRQAEAYRKNLYRRCSSEFCNITALTVHNAVRSLQTCADAAATLWQVLPWFDFTILKLSARGKYYSKGSNRLRSTTVSLKGGLFFDIFWSPKEEYQSKDVNNKDNTVALLIPAAYVLDHYNNGSSEVLTSYTASGGASVYKGFTMDTTANETYFLVSGKGEQLKMSCEPHIHNGGDSSISNNVLISENLLSAIMFMNIIYHIFSRIP